MFQKSALIVVGPLALLLCLSPISFTSGISDLSKGAVVGIFLGFILLGLKCAKRKPAKFN